MWYGIIFLLLIYPLWSLYFCLVLDNNNLLFWEWNSYALILEKINQWIINNTIVTYCISNDFHWISGESNWDYERRMRTFRRRLREADWTWLTACMGVVEADMNPVEAYLNTGGDPTRKLTNPEVAMLNRPSVYEAGHTLVHLAIK